jgi:hypothetical protein
LNEWAPVFLKKKDGAYSSQFSVRLSPDELNRNTLYQGGKAGSLIALRPERSDWVDSLPNIDFEAMKNIDIRTVNPDTLVDINDTKVNAKLPIEERILDFIQQIKNPYCYKCGKVVVKISFNDSGATLEDRMESFLRMM